MLKDITNFIDGQCENTNYLKKKKQMRRIIQAKEREMRDRDDAE